MENRSKTIFLIGLMMLVFLAAAVPETSTLEQNHSLSPIPNESHVETVIDPSVAAAVSNHETMQISIRSTHVLNDAEIRYLEKNGVVFRKRAGKIVRAGTIYLAKINSLSAIEAITSTGYIEQLDANSDLNDVHLDQSIGNISADLSYALKDPDIDSQNITGKGVTVAIIDTGIDWQHPDFYFADGGEFHYRHDAASGYYIDLDNDSNYDAGEKTYYFDLTGDGGTVDTFDPEYDWIIVDTNGNGATYDYGVDYAFVANDTNDNDVLDIGEKCARLETCKISKIWDQTTGDFYIQGANLTDPSINNQVDTDGHGTHVAGTVAGGQLGYRTYRGVAPDAEIMMVKTTFSSSDIMDAVIWAVSEGADVISMSIGGYIHRPLDGSTNYEQTFDWAYDQGVPCVVSAGNSANDQTHSYFSLPASTESYVRFEVTSAEQTDVYLTTLWRTPSNDLSIRIQPPYAIAPSPIFSIPVDGSPVNVEDNIVSAYRYTSTRDTAYITIHITYQSPRTEVETGTWYLYLNNADTSSEVAHTYIYPSGSNRMIDVVSSDYTVTSPATADTVIAVGSYVTKLGGSSSTLFDLSAFSSRGPRIDGQLKPEVAAPGEMIMSASSKDAGGSYGGHLELQGTSMACPHVSGVLALAVQCHPSGMHYSSTSLRDDLLQSADQDGYTGSVPNSMWGYGKLDAFESVVREGPVISEVRVDDVYLAESESMDVVRGESFMLSVLVTDDQSYHDLSVVMEYSEAGGSVDGAFDLIYDPESGRWSASLHATSVSELVTYNFTIIVSDPLFSAEPYTIFIDVVNELPIVHATHLNATSVLRTKSIEFAVNASDYHDLNNLTVTLCLERPDASWLNISMTWNGTLFIQSMLFNTTNQVGQWQVYVQVADQDGGVVSELQTNLSVLNNQPTVSGSLDATDIILGNYLEVNITSGDIEDGWADLTLYVCLRDSEDNWFNTTVTVSSADDTVQIDTTGFHDGSYDVYVVATDTDGGQSENHSGSVSIVDDTPPDIDSPSDIQYDESSTGNAITWSPSDPSPASYAIYLNGTPVKSGAWNSSSESITISVDGHNIGIYNYTIIVTDSGSNTASDQVLVVVVDGTAPTIDSPPDIEYFEGDTGNRIEWSAYDQNPGEYVIFRNGSSVFSTNWESSAVSISISIDGLDVGTYNYTIIVSDIAGNEASDTVVVVVKEELSTTTDTSDTTTPTTTPTSTPTLLDPRMVIVVGVGITTIAVVIIVLAMRKR